MTIDGSAYMKSVRLAQVALTFVVLYWTANQLTSLRGDVGRGVFAWERAIPFVELSILPYLSIFALFVASFFACRGRDELERHCARLLLALCVSIVCYAAFPLRFEQRPVPRGALSGLFHWLWTVDLPFNRAPSLHISVLVILWARFAGCLPKRHRPLLHTWMSAIGVSVLTTYQHHVIDVASGLLVGALCLSIPTRWLRRLQGRDASEAILVTPPAEPAPDREPDRRGPQAVRAMASPPANDTASRGTTGCRAVVHVQASARIARRPPAPEALATDRGDATVK